MVLAGWRAADEETDATHGGTGGAERTRLRPLRMVG